MRRTFFYLKERPDREHLHIQLAVIYGEGAPRRTWMGTVDDGPAHELDFYGYGYALQLRMFVLAGEIIGGHYDRLAITPFLSCAPVYPNAHNPQFTMERRFYYPEYQIITPAQAEAVYRTVFADRKCFTSHTFPPSAFLEEIPPPCDTL